MSNKNILINETFIVDHSVKDLWVSEFKAIYIKELKKSGLVSDIIFSKVVSDYNPDGISYALQYKTDQKNIEVIQADKILSSNRNHLDNKYKNQFASFVTFLEII
ncbi:MAG TPA: DUF4286 family protein [Bacteroidetes bacterium]|nr:DUF4286 family protein [Bacteroidota bacterium]